ncbi:MAG: hypothetical protein ACYS5V_17040, partial [Planctomycetota bacterium]
MIRLFDACVGFGGARPGQRELVTAAELAAELERLTITAGLARIAPTNLDSDVVFSNRALLDACDGHDALTPCPAVVPNTCGDLPDEADQIGQALARGAGAVCLRPKCDYWTLRGWGCGRLMALLAQHRLPIWCEEDQVPPTELAELAGGAPDVPILYRPAAYRGLRVIEPLLKAFDNVHLVVGARLSVHRVVEHLAEAVGADRLLFGT